MQRGYSCSLVLRTWVWVVGISAIYTAGGLGQGPGRRGVAGASQAFDGQVEQHRNVYTGFFLMTHLEKSQTFKIATFNIAKSSTFNKLAILKDFIKQKDIDIMCLTEISATDITIPNFCYIKNFDPITKVGVALLYRYDIPISEVHKHPSGRILRCNINGYVLIVVYSPSGNDNKHKRTMFFHNELAFELQSCHRHEIILLGDMNSTIDETDSTAQTSYCKALDDVTKEFSLRDLFKVLRPGEYKPTYFYFKGHSKIDAIYTSSGLAQQARYIDTLKLAFSDHSVLWCVIQLPEMKFMQSTPRWFFNQTYLLHTDYQLLIESEWKEAVLRKTKYVNRFLWWRYTMNRLEQVSKEYCRWKAKLKYDQLYYYQGLLSEAVEAFIQGTGTLDAVRKFQAMIVKLYTNQKKGVLLRSKFNAVGIEEPPTYIHVKKERNRGGKKFISTFVNERGEIARGKAVYKAIYRQYSEVFANTPINEKVLSEFLAEVHMPVLTQDAHTLLEAPFTAEEVTQALKLVNHKATAGSSGINAQWAWQFKHLIVSDLVQVFNYIWEHSKSDKKFWESIGILLPKNTATTSINNSRLIHLFNWEYKVLTKCVQIRMFQCIMPILHPAQCGLPTSPPLHFILSQIREVIHHAHVLKEEQAAILSLDISRAFDDLSHAFLFRILQLIGIPAKFTNFLRYIFENRSVKIQVDNFLTAPIHLAKGVPQGDSLSPILYTIAMAPILYYLDKIMVGTPYRGASPTQGASLKFYSYLDDQCFFPSNAEEINKIINVYDTVQLIAGMHLNKQKSKILLLGNNICEYSERIPVVSSVKILGIKWFSNIDMTAKYNIQLVVNRMVHDCVSHKSLFTTIGARARFLNVFIYSKASYILQLFLLDNKSLATILKFTGDFIWYRQILRTPREILYLPEELGGVNLTHIGLQNKALMIHRTLSILCDTSSSFSQTFLMQILKLIDIDGPINMKPWGPCIPYLQHVLLDIAYAHLAKVNIDQENVRTIYKTLLTSHLQRNEKVMSMVNNVKYRESWQLLLMLKAIPLVNDLMYKIYHSVFMTKDKLHSKGIISSPLCAKCGVKEDFQHVLFECHSNEEVWLGFSDIIKRVTRSNFSLDMVQKMLSLPLQRYFPPTKTKFIIWLLAQTTYWIIQDKVEWSRDMYIEMLRFSSQQFCKHGQINMANFHRAIY
jgi:exonuclease III